jgi:hypothetical protein
LAAARSGPPATSRHRPENSDASTPTPTIWASTRLIVCRKGAVKRDEVDPNEEWAEAKNKGKVCTRSGSHPDNVSPFGSVLEHLGLQKIDACLNGIVGPMARRRKMGRYRSDLSACKRRLPIALTNSDYLARPLRSQVHGDRAVANKIGIVVGNPISCGTQVNIAERAQWKPRNPARERISPYYAETIHISVVGLVRSQCGRRLIASVIALGPRTQRVR